MTELHQTEHEEHHILIPNDFGKLKPYCSDASIAYLEGSLSRLEKGSPPTPSFPLYGKRDSSLLEGVRDILGNSKSPSWLVEYEATREAKFGPQGGTPSWKDIKEDFMLYRTALKDVKYVDASILRTMQQEYKTLRCQELGAAEVLAHLIKTDKVETRAAGWSEFQLKKTDARAQELALRYALDGSWKAGYGYVFTRYSKLKKRIFMPMPFSSMIVQAKWFVPFLGNIQKSLLAEGTRSPYVLWADKIGFEHCFQIMEQELNTSKLADDEYIVYFSNDFEKMDTRTGTSQYKSFFLPMLEAAFGGYTTMREAMLFTTEAPIITPGGTLLGPHGTASGAEVTNGGETVCNDYFQRRVIKVLQAVFPNKFRVVARRGNGDDSIIIFFVKKTLAFKTFEQKLSQALAQVCSETGFDAQTEKLDISTTFGKYCQNVLQYNPKTRTLFWTYPITLVLNSIVNPETEYTPKSWDKDYRDIDVIEKLDNASRHPAYEAFVTYVDNGMKYHLLGSSEAETQRILSKYDKFRALQSLSERYNRQDYTISASPTVRLILSRR